MTLREAFTELINKNGIEILDTPEKCKAYLATQGINEDKLTLDLFYDVLEKNIPLQIRKSTYRSPEITTYNLAINIYTNIYGHEKIRNEIENILISHIELIISIFEQHEVTTSKTFDSWHKAKFAQSLKDAVAVLVKEYGTNTLDNFHRTHALLQDITGNEISDEVESFMKFLDEFSNEKEFSGTTSQILKNINVLKDSLPNSDDRCQILKELNSKYVKLLKMEKQDETSEISDEIENANDMEMYDDEYIRLFIAVRAGFDINIQDADGDTLLMVAAERGEIERLKLLINLGANVNIQNKDGWSALNYAIDGGYTDIVAELISAGANVNIKDNRYGISTLVLSIISYASDISALLINNGADINARDAGTGTTPLIWAADSNSVKVAKLLIDAGADINAQCSIYGRTALICAANNKSVPLAKILIDAGADKEIEDRDGYTALDYAKNNGCQEIVDLLESPFPEAQTIISDEEEKSYDELSDSAAFPNTAEPQQDYIESKTEQTKNCTRSIDSIETNSPEINTFDSEVEKVSSDEMLQEDTKKFLFNNNKSNKSFIVAMCISTILFVLCGAIYISENRRVTFLNSARTNNVTEVEKLLKKGISVHTRDVNMLQSYTQKGNSVFQIAVMNNAVDVARLLASEGADIEEVLDSRNTTPLMFAVENNFSEMVDALVKSGADVNIVNTHGFTPLMIAAQDNYLESARIMLDAKAYINATTPKGMTPLMISILNHNPEIAKQLLKYKANVNRQTNDGWTALMICAQEDMADIAQLLINDGAYINTPVTTTSKSTALMIAAQNNAINVARVLIRSGAKLNLQNADGRTALMIAVMNNSVDVTNIILDAKADINATTPKGLTPLMISILNHNPEIAKQLLKYKANVNLQTNDGHTALMICAQEDMADIAQLLINNGAYINTPVATTDKCTALMIAALQNAVDVAKILIQSGAKLNLQTVDGRTALMIAAVNNSVDVARILIRAGADLQIREKGFFFSGPNALELARRYKSKEVEELLIAAGAK